MKNFNYFKIAFLAITAGLFAGLFVFGLFEIDFSNTKVLTALFFKSLVTSVATGLILGVLNMYFKMGINQQ